MDITEHRHHEPEFDTRNSASPDHGGQSSLEMQAGALSIRGSLLGVLLARWTSSHQVSGASPVARLQYKAFLRYILDNPSEFRDANVLDFGCGCGSASIAATRAGASVIANDVDTSELRTDMISHELSLGHL